jgi:hypothetical protein
VNTVTGKENIVKHIQCNKYINRATFMHGFFNTNFNFHGKMDKLYNMNITVLVSSSSTYYMLQLFMKPSSGKYI